ncbi:MAG: MinD/ParA family protein [Pseudomonadota bacterium]
MTAAVHPIARQPLSLEKRLVTIASGKGGVGKTWLAITLAHALARAGRRVLLFDGDLGLANIDIQLGLTPEHDLGDVISGRLTLKEALTNFSAGGAQKSDFDILAGKSGSGALSMLARERLASLRQSLVAAAQDYDHVVLDLAAGVDVAVTTLASHAGPNLVVVTPEPTSLTDAYAFIKLRRMRDPDANLHIVVNQASDKREGETTYETLKNACANFLKFTPPLAGIVKRDAKVSDAIRHQAPLLARHPQTEASQAVEALAKALIAAAKRRRQAP